MTTDDETTDDGAAGSGAAGARPGGAATVGRGPVALYGFLRPRTERAADVRRLMAGLVESSRQEEGNLAYHLHDQDDGRLFLYEVWRSRQDLDRHNATPLLRDFLDHLTDYLEEAPEAYAGAMISPYPGFRDGS